MVLENFSEIFFSNRLVLHRSMAFERKIDETRRRDYFI